MAKDGQDPNKLIHWHQKFAQTMATSLSGSSKQVAFGQMYGTSAQQISGSYWQSSPGPAELTEGACQGSWGVQGSKDKKVRDALQPYVKVYEETLKAFFQSADPKIWAQAMKLHTQIQRAFESGTVTSELKGTAILTKLRKQKTI